MCIRDSSIAVVFQKRLFTYRELYDKCMSISQLLDQAGVKANTVVAVSMQRSMEMIASILAIMHRKAVFLLLDINQPKRRLQAIISQSKPECILSCNLAGSIQAVPTGEQTPHVFQTAIAYLGFTSGSTGKPKGDVYKRQPLFCITGLNYNQLVQTLVNRNTTAFDHTGT